MTSEPKSAPESSLFEPQTRTNPSVLIIGAGISGLCTAIDLLKRGISDFIILEKSAGVGGTWYDNTYPGCRCDVWSLLYSFSFAQNSDWTRLYPGQPEILDYLVSVAQSYRLYKYIRFNSEVESCTWSDERMTWSVDVKVVGGKEREVREGYTTEADWVVSAVGQLNYPRYPDIPGLEAFRGKMMHSARWDWSYDVRGKRVAVIGNGATAAQIIPEIVRTASHLTVYQRSPNWVLDRHDHTISPFLRTLYRWVPPLRWRARASMMDIREAFHTLITDGDSDLAESARQMTRRKLIEAFPQDKAMREKLTPKFHPGCKRVILSDDYIPALARENCSLETRSIKRITESGIEVVPEIPADVGAVEEEFDLIVLATGFRAVEFLHPIQIRGKHGRLISEAWEGGARALYGAMVHDMPNFGILYGPNTNLSHNSLILMIETQSRYITALISAAIDAKKQGRSLAITPRSKRVEEYNEDLQNALGKTSFADRRCSSWFKNDEGKITTNWSGTAVDYQKLMSRVNWGDYELEGSAASDVEAKRELELGRVVEETQVSDIGIMAAGALGLVGAAGGLMARTYRMLSAVQ